MKARIVYESASERVVEAEVSRGDDCIVVRLGKETVSGAMYVDFLYDCFTARAGDDGYFVTTFTTEGTVLTRFTPRSDCEDSTECSYLGCYGWNHGEKGTLAVVAGMRNDFGMVVGVKNKIYYAYPRFYIDGGAAEEDIEVRLIELVDGSYSGMARAYRQWQLNHGCRPLRERVAGDPRLRLGAEGIAVRVRQSWKPVPSPVEEQTPETEPPLHAACTFDRTGKLADEFRRQGIRNAEFCLVGWNIGGHDGRFPQIFPPEPQLGGEERLRALIKKVKEDGYGIVCHDDATAAYRIADCWDEKYLLKNKDLGLHKRPYCWGGGRPYKVCPRRQYERFEVPNQQKLREYGFEGIHYIDVMTILPLLQCYDPNHPLSRSGSAEWYSRIMRLSRENFGGFSSESGFDFAAADLDYALYIGFQIGAESSLALGDEQIPFWSLVYHGIILYNSSTYTLNYAAKGAANRLKYFEYGGRPLACFYANFATDRHWMGREDLVCDTDEQMRESVAIVKAMADDYESLRDVWYEYIDSHEKLSDGVYRTTYSNGVKITVNYNDESLHIER